MNRQKFLEEMINSCGFTIGAELGLWDGRTYLYLLDKCHDLTLIGVDLWRPQGFYKGVDRYGNSWTAESHQMHENKVRAGAARFGERSLLFKTSTNDAAKLIDDAYLDFVFIDADHSVEAVFADITNWLPKIKPGGFIFGHDIDWHSVKVAVELKFDDYEIGPDNIWFKKID